MTKHFSIRPIAFFLRCCALLVALLLGATIVNNAHAQQAMPDNNAPNDNVVNGDAGVLPAPAAAPGGGAQILEVGEDDVASLRNLNTSGRANAVSLSVSLAVLQADNAALQSLQSWVQNGGVVFLHTDAAQLFGYQTVPARESDNRLAGQLFGRAVAALPFGANPLLWSSSSGAALDGQSLPQLGIQTVYYQMQAGDQLVVSHPAGTPLLRVTDLAMPGGQTLYAAAIAPYGSGWAVFTPRLVEQPRADGAAFIRNIVLLANGGGNSVFAPLGQGMAPAASRVFFVGLPASLIENATQAEGGNYSALVAAWDKATKRDPASAMMQPNVPIIAETEPRLIVTAQEAGALRAVLGAAALDGGGTRAQAALALLRARLELQRNDLNAARTWLETAGTLAPGAAEVLLWQGVWSAASSENLLLASPVRGRFLADAVADWRRAQNAVALLPAGSTPNASNAAANGAAGANDAGATISGVPAQTLQNWIAAATRAGELTLAEPPLVTPIGGANRVVLLRHFPDDPTLRTALPTGALLAQADEFLGANLDVEEILIFPNDRYYQQYSQAAHIGSNQVTFSPLADRGNVIGNRILMVSQITVPVLLSPGPPPIYAPLGQAVPAVIARLHAQVLLHAIAQDGAQVPAWMQLGLMSLSNIAVTSRLGNDSVSDALSKTVQVNGLLAPEQFENVNLGADKTGLPEEQARRLMLFFYARFGAGAVIETLQRIGSGQDAEDALIATTELGQTEFFIAWRDAEFGNRPRR